MQVEKSIPIPTKKRFKRVYPFDLLESSGDSVFIENLPELKDILRVRVAARQYAVYHDFRVTTSKENGGLRVWRL